MSPTLRTKKHPTQRNTTKKTSTKRPIKRVVKRVVKHITKRVMKKGPLKRLQDSFDTDYPRDPPSLEKITNVDLDRDGNIDGGSDRSYSPTPRKYKPKRGSDITEVDTMIRSSRRRRTPFPPDNDAGVTFEIGRNEMNSSLTPRKGRVSSSYFVKMDI